MSNANEYSNPPKTLTGVKLLQQKFNTMYWYASLLLPFYFYALDTFLYLVYN